MAYTRVNWLPNQLVTADNLNKMDIGIEKAPYRNDAGSGYSMLFTEGYTVPIHSTGDSADTLTNTTGHGSLNFRDKEERISSAIVSIIDGKTVTTSLRATIPIDDTNYIFNDIAVTIDRSEPKDTRASYSVTSPAAFRKAIACPRKMVIKTANWSDNIFPILNDLTSLETGTIYLTSGVASYLTNGKITVYVAGTVTKLDEANTSNVLYEFMVRGLKTDNVTDDSKTYAIYLFTINTTDSGASYTVSNIRKIESTAVS